ncbi:MAG TPA: DUF3566 domain-containing protein, partial [Microthrixaceae bacterium]|nr:DUF3566 domain-containing protein [Microthrixaceae bacterium]
MAVNPSDVGRSRRTDQGGGPAGQPRAADRSPGAPPAPTVSTPPATRRTPAPGVSPGAARQPDDRPPATAAPTAAAPAVPWTDAQPATEPATEPLPSHTVTHRNLRGRRQQFEARKVRRLIRHIEPWSVLKLSLLLFLSLWLVFMIAAVIVWSVANGS